MEFCGKIVAVLLLSMMATTCMVAQMTQLDALKEALLRARTPVERASANLEVAWYLQNAGGESPKPYLDSALAQSLRNGDGANIATAHVQLGLYAQGNGDFEDAATHYKVALPIRKALGNTLGMASVYNNLGSLEMLQANFHEAEEHYLRGLAIAERANDVDHSAKIAGQLCELYNRESKFDLSLQFGFRAEKILRANSPVDSGQLGRTYRAIGTTFFRKSDLAQTKQYYALAQECLQAANATKDLCTLLDDYGNIALYGAEFETAIERYRQGLALRWQLYDTISALNSMRNIGLAQRLAGDYEAAQATFQDAQKIAGDAPKGFMSLLLKADIAESRYWQGHPEEAIALLEPILAGIDSLGEVAFRVDFREVLSMAYAATSDWPRAQDFNRQGLALQQQLDAARNGETYTSYLQEINQRQKVQREKEKLIEDAKLATSQSQTLRAVIVALAILLVLGAVIAFLVLQNRRRLAAEALRIEQSKRKISSEIEASERSRIGRDLHDHVGGLLAALKLQIADFQSHGNADSLASAQTLAQFGASFDRLMNEVRKVAHNLAGAGHVSLLENLNQYCAIVEGTGVLAVDKDLRGLEPRLPMEMEQHLYMMISELFSNVIRYAEAKKVTLQTFRAEGTITVMFEDDGKGFDPKSPGVQKGQGMKNLELRRQFLGGKISFDSAPGRGTIITIEVPLSA